MSYTMAEEGELKEEQGEEHLIEFFGTECKHCHEMTPLVGRLEEELGLKLTKLEVWHNETNKKKLEELDQGRCGGVPFFINTKTNDFICGSADYDKLKAWATGK